MCTGLPHITASLLALQHHRIVKNGDRSYTVTYRQGADGAEQQMEVGLVMMATGRHPRVAGLNLEVRVGW
jgi:pyruvate/2-oxoglutarate dehydrogenase complex dihydrolipoamide dehydrogenase (E3) component